jgi:hypothetical protein
MDLIKINQEELKKIFSRIEANPEEATGTFLYKGYRIQISKYRATGSERYSRLYWKRKEKGQCIRCGKKVTKKNPSTGTLYRLCELHRETTDKK